MVQVGELERERREGRKWATPDKRWWPRETRLEMGWIATPGIGSQERVWPVKAWPRRQAAWSSFQMESSMGKGCGDPILMDGSVKALPALTLYQLLFHGKLWRAYSAWVSESPSSLDPLPAFIPWKALKSLLSMAQKTSILSFGRKIIMPWVQKTKTFFFFLPQTHAPPQLGPGHFGNQARKLLHSSWPVSTKAMIHRFPVETETLKHSLNRGEAHSLASAPIRK